MVDGFGSPGNGVFSCYLVKHFPFSQLTVLAGCRFGEVSCLHRVCATQYGFQNILFLV